MARVFLICFCCISLSCKPRAASDLASDDGKTALELIELHRVRLNADLKELQTLKEDPNVQGWLAEAVAIRTEMKQNSLQQLERNATRFSDTTALPLPQQPTALDMIRSPGDGVMEPNRSISRDEVGFNFVIPKVLRKLSSFEDDPSGWVFLQKIGDLDIPLADLREQSTKVQAKLVLQYGIGLPPMLSRLVARAEIHVRTIEERLQSNNLAELRTAVAQVQNVLENLGSRVFAESYADPTVISPAWIDLMTRSNGVAPTEADIAAQLKKQGSYISKADLQLSVQERGARWIALTDALLEIYHKPLFRKVAQSYATEFGRVVSGLKLKSITPLPEQIDLSARFQAPLSQGHSNACAAFAMVADVETLAHEDLSPGLAYGQYLAAKEGWFFHYYTNAKASIEHRYRDKKMDEDHLYAFLDKGAEPQELLRQLRTHPLTSEDNFKFTESTWLPAEVNSIPNRSTLVKEAFYDYTPASIDDLKLLLVNDIAPMLLIKYEARTFIEDWYQPEPLSTVGHAINLVGYGSAVDPFDLKHKTYFVVRDSFSNHPIHYRVAADELAPLVEGIFKIMSIRKTSEPVQYPVFNPADDANN